MDVTHFRILNLKYFGKCRYDAIFAGEKGIRPVEKN